MASMVGGFFQKKSMVGGGRETGTVKEYNGHQSRTSKPTFLHVLLQYFKIAYEHPC